MPSPSRFASSPEIVDERPDSAAGRERRRSPDVLPQMGDGRSCDPQAVRAAVLGMPCLEIVKDLTDGLKRLEVFAKAMSATISVVKSWTMPGVVDGGKGVTEKDVLSEVSSVYTDLHKRLEGECKDSIMSVAPSPSPLDRSPRITYESMSITVDGVDEPGSVVLQSLSFAEQVAWKRSKSYLRQQQLKQAEASYHLESSSKQLQPTRERVLAVTTLRDFAREFESITVRTFMPAWDIAIGLVEHSLGPGGLEASQQPSLQDLTQAVRDMRDRLGDEIEVRLREAEAKQKECEMQVRNLQKQLSKQEKELETSRAEVTLKRALERKCAQMAKMVEAKESEVQRLLRSVEAMDGEMAGKRSVSKELIDGKDIQTISAELAKKDQELSRALEDVRVLERDNAKMKAEMADGPWKQLTALKRENNSLMVDALETAEENMKLVSEDKKEEATARWKRINQRRGAVSAFQGVAALAKGSKAFMGLGGGSGGDG